MLSLINLLIIFFVVLIVYEIFLAYIGNYIVEGLENQYQPYDTNNPSNALILAQQNAGNIEVLKGRIDGFDGVKEKVDTMQQSIDSMQVQIDGLVQQQADYAQELAGPTPPDVTGTDYETTENVEDSLEEEN